MVTTGLTPDDETWLEGQGISVDLARRQLAMLGRPPRYADVVRPCTVGDGVKRIADPEVPELHALHAGAAESGRFLKFVPASGAASRMFKSLLSFQRGARATVTAWPEVESLAADGQDEARELVELVRGIRGFAFHDELRQVLARRGQDLGTLIRTRAFTTVLDTLLGASGMDYAGRPKGLLAFHRYAGEVRTPFEEHLVEAAEYARDGRNTCRLHFTVSPEHRDGFVELASRVVPDLEQRHGVRFEIEYSAQHPATDTPALDEDGTPLRDERGRLRLRPGGHGALIRNLNDLQADLVFVKNIDNVQPDRVKPDVAAWKKTLAGFLVRLQRGVFEHLERLEAPAPSRRAIDDAAGFVREHLHLDPGRVSDDRDATRRRLVDRLARPIRVCGVVPNRDEPGGGPFWVRRVDGSVDPQIVELAQIDPDRPDRRHILEGSTHFNPVDLVCAVRDRHGRQFDLTRFVDPDAAIVTTKSEAGRQVRALELPGLWNGAMAAWSTVFVEVPLTTFSPVKTVLDLLRPEHRTE